MTEPDVEVTIVGAGFSGIGAAIAIAAAAEHDVVLGHTGASDVGALVERVAAAGARVVDHAADVADESQVVAMFRRIDAELGPVDVLINNAGIADYALINAISPERWRRPSAPGGSRSRYSRCGRRCWRRSPPAWSTRSRRSAPAITCSSPTGGGTPTS